MSGPEPRPEPEPDIIQGTGSRDILQGGSGADTLVAGQGNDRLNGRQGADRMQGGKGNDSYVVDNAADQVIELAGEGLDAVDATVSFVLGANVENLMLLGTSAIDGTGNDLANTINGNEAANLITGEGGDDQLRGKGGNDYLSGGAGNDYLSGGAGTDTLTGGAGSDEMYGGAGADRFVFERLSDFGPSGAPDRLQDFSASQGDRIDLSGIDADSTQAGDQGFAFLGREAFTGRAGQLRYETAPGGMLRVSGDLNGDGAAELQFLVRASALTGADFLL